jgi:putative DNA primase/helicase
MKGCLGISEGVETALAATKKFGVPTWAAISAEGMAAWIPPDATGSVRIFGDNDLSFTGQWASYACARAIRGKRPNLEIVVEMPPEIGTDWADP